MELIEFPKPKDENDFRELPSVGVLEAFNTIAKVVEDLNAVTGKLLKVSERLMGTVQRHVDKEASK